MSPLDRRPRLAPSSLGELDQGLCIHRDRTVDEKIETAESRLCGLHRLYAVRAAAYIQFDELGLRRA